METWKLGFIAYIFAALSWLALFLHLSERLRSELSAKVGKHFRAEMLDAAEDIAIAWPGKPDRRSIFYWSMLLRVHRHHYPESGLRICFWFLLIAPLAYILFCVIYILTTHRAPPPFVDR